MGLICKAVCYFVKHVLKVLPLSLIHPFFLSFELGQGAREKLPLCSSVRGRGDERSSSILCLRQVLQLLVKELPPCCQFCAGLMRKVPWEHHSSGNIPLSLVYTLFRKQYQESWEKCKIVSISPRRKKTIKSPPEKSSPALGLWPFLLKEKCGNVYGSEMYTVRSCFEKYNFGSLLLLSRFLPDFTHMLH